jgi:hypothetical protein
MGSFLSAAIRGAIGPARFFKIGTPYGSLMFGFGIGILLPLIPWGLNKLWPHSYWHLGI